MREIYMITLRTLDLMGHELSASRLKGDDQTEVRRLWRNLLLRIGGAPNARIIERKTDKMRAIMPDGRTVREVVFSAIPLDCEDYPTANMI